MNNLSIYHEKILALASQNKGSKEIDDFNSSFDMKNPMCGDEVKIRVKITNEIIQDVSAIVRGCALCEASAGLVIQIFKNNDISKDDFIKKFLLWLEMKSVNLPDELPKEIEIFEPIREISNRHKCVSMPFEAIINSINDYKLKNKN